MRYQHYEVVDNCQSLYLLLYCSLERLDLFLSPVFGVCPAVCEFISGSELWSANNCE